MSLSPHETIARMRAYQTALDLVRLDIKDEQHNETGPHRIDELARVLRRRSPALQEYELDHAAVELNDQNLASLLKYVAEVGWLHGELQRVVDNPSLLQYAARDKVVNLGRVRIVLRRALHRYSLELGWLLPKIGGDRPQNWNTRTEDLFHRIAVLSRALHFQTEKNYQQLSIHMLFQSYEPM